MKTLLGLLISTDPAPAPPLSYELIGTPPIDAYNATNFAQLNTDYPVHNSLPKIDLALLTESHGKRAIARDFRSAYAGLGFGAVVNHGIDRHLLNRLFDASRRFHALPLADKMKVELNSVHRGYIPIDTSTDVNSTLADVTKPNQSESFMMMREDAADSAPVQQQAYLAGANQWPELEGFRTALVAANDAFASLARTLLGIACLALNVAPSRLLPAFECPTTWLRLLHYPPQPSDYDGYGSAPHTDFGCLTLLAQDNVAGLQVKDNEGAWIDVEPDPDTIIVNVGDMLHRWSNGILKSTPHRVINHSGLERYSCAFFFDPYVETIVAPLDECITAGQSAKFEPVHFGDFLRAELEAAYQHHQAGG
jgi:isopenicillin N synthase-like dioxygenase